MYITPIWVLADVLQMALTDFKDLHWLKKIAIVSIGVLVAIFGIFSDRADIKDRTATRTQLINLQTDNTRLITLVSDLAASQAIAAQPGLKQDALELGLMLMRR